MIKLKIDVTKISKRHLFAGTKGTYLDLALKDNKDGKDQYGNDGFIVQEISKEARESGEKGPIIGNWRNVEFGNKNAEKPVSRRQEVAAAKEDGLHPDECPF